MSESITYLFHINTHLSPSLSVSIQSHFNLSKAFFLFPLSPYFLLTFDDDLKKKINDKKNPKAPKQQ